MGAESSADSVRSVTRALGLLTLFDEDHPLHSLRDLLDRTELPKTTVLRLIQTLEQCGYLHTRPDGRFCPGPALIPLSRAVDLVWRLPMLADGLMESLRERTRETVNLYVVEGLSRVCVVQKQGPLHVRYVVPIGVSLPLWAGASGKVLLADRPREFVEAVLRAAGKGEDFGAGLAVELERVRAAGFGASHGEREVGASSVAAPIRDGKRGTVAAITISGPTSRFTPDRVEEFAALLKEAVGQMALSLSALTEGDSSGVLWHGRAAAR
ncbi:MAG: IclR family transcriptional regulator [Chloroflexi bacterium]|nr:MAG: IclR family transcriptional regulator [Chloroflexota bacterium]